VRYSFITCFVGTNIHLCSILLLLFLFSIKYGLTSYPFVDSTYFHQFC
jgi:hypothetical protein